MVDCWNVKYKHKILLCCVVAIAPELFSFLFYSFYLYYYIAAAAAAVPFHSSTFTLDSSPLD